MYCAKIVLTFSFPHFVPLYYIFMSHVDYKLLIRHAREREPCIRVCVYFLIYSLYL